jgi:hypothetical protein
VNPFIKLAEAWLQDAATLRLYGDDRGAQICLLHAEAVRAMARSTGDEPLPLEQAAAESGYSADRLRHMIGEGKIANAGRKGSPRIRRADLPVKPGRAKPAVSGFDAGAFARSLLPGGGGR